MDLIIEQNKVLARGLTLIHEKNTYDSPEYVKSQESFKFKSSEKNFQEKEFPVQKSMKIPEFKENSFDQIGLKEENNLKGYGKPSPFQKQ